MADRKYETITVEHRDSAAWLTLDRPEKLNALSALLLDELDDAVDRAARHDDTRVLIIRGAGRCFSAGYDVAAAPKQDGEYLAEVDIVDDWARIHRNIGRLMKLRELAKPVIAAVHGYCLAGATQICMFCDIIVVADDAVIGVPSLPLGAGLLGPMWAQRVGAQRAKQLFFVAGSKISGAQAADWSWANYSVPAADLFDDVASLAERMALMPAKALELEKQAINRADEIGSLRAVVAMGADIDGLAHEAGFAKEVRRRISEDGLRATIRAFEGTRGEAS
jgi:enoyl-CoA hydratase